MMTEIEYSFQCPYCWQSISMLLEPNPDDQDYFEDCEVCCKPIHLQFHFYNDNVSGFRAMSLNER